MPKLLTIAIPTYNRKSYLSKLVEVILKQIADLGDMVELVISDNHSTDGTAEFLNQLSIDHPEIIICRAEQNHGMDKNYCVCYENAHSEYLWIISDDDLPKQNAIPKILGILEKEKPDLIHMGSEWVNDIQSDMQGTPITDISHVSLSRNEFAIATNIWFTYLSSIITRKSLLASRPSFQHKKYVGTFLSLLAWEFEVLKFGTKFVFIKDKCLLATRDNTGGYAALKVFGETFPSIVEEVFGKDHTISRGILNRMICNFLTVLIWRVRFNNKNNAFSSDSNLQAIRSHFKGSVWFYLFVIPVFVTPRYLSFAFAVVAKIVSKVQERFAAYFWHRL